MSIESPHFGNLRSWGLGLVGTVAVGLVTSWFGYVHSALRDHDQRLPVIESKQQDQGHQLHRIENKIDKLLERGN